MKCGEIAFKMMKLTLWDKLLITFILAASALGFTFNTNLNASMESQKYLMVQVSGEIIMEYSFHKDTEEVLHISYQENEEQKAELEIGEGKVRMLPMSRDVCPRGICSETGWISRGHQSIVCLPNKIVITMRASTAEKEHYENKKIDGITY